MNPLSEAFDDERFQEKVQRELLGLILKADIEASKYGKLGLVKGSVRKRYLIHFLIDYFGEEGIETTVQENIPYIDVTIDSLPVKIKTITGKGGVKIKWTIDRHKVEMFLSDYTPSCGILLVRLNWGMEERNRPSGLFWIPLEVQQSVLKRLSVEIYLKPPKPGTNSRGIALSRQALEMLLIDDETKHIDVDWRRPPR